MIVDKLTTRALDVADLPDGDYKLHIVDGKATAWVESTDAVQTITAGDGIAVDDTDPDSPVVSALTPLVTVVDGQPGLVFGGDGRIVFTEAT